MEKQNPTQQKHAFTITSHHMEKTDAGLNGLCI